MILMKLTYLKMMVNFSSSKLDILAFARGNALIEKYFRHDSRFETRDIELGNS